MDYKIAFFSFADIDNFGDILFSHIFEMEIKNRLPNSQIDYYAPSAFQAGGINYIPYSRSKIKNNYDALIVFGGEVVHLYDERTWKPFYTKHNKVLESDLPSDVIFDWTNLPNTYKAWISVGVRPIANEKDYAKIEKAVSNLDYISTRGALSKKILENLKLEFNNSKIEMTPDLGWLFPKLLDASKSRGKLYSKYISSNKYLVFQINSITEDEAKEIAKYLLQFKEEHNIDIVLLPIIKPWEDLKYLEMIDRYGKGNFTLVKNNLNILETLDILLNAHLTLTSSLHGAITALSEGIPAGILNKWNGTKLQDIFGQQFRLHLVTHLLNGMPQVLKNLMEEREKETALLKMYSNYMQMKLGIVFDQLVSNIKDERK